MMDVVPAQPNAHSLQNERAPACSLDNATFMDIVGPQQTRHQAVLTCSCCLVPLQLSTHPSMALRREQCCRKLAYSTIQTWIPGGVRRWGGYSRCTG